MSNDIMQDVFIKKRIVGELIYSKNISEALKRCRQIFRVSQKELSKELKISPSVISDYENSRRKTPGFSFIKKIVDALVYLDTKSEYRTLKNIEALCKTSIPLSDLVDISSFRKKTSFQELVKHIHGRVLTSSEIRPAEIHGYVIIDNFEFILRLDIDDFSILNKWVPRRALILSKITSGKTSLTAMKLKGTRPGLVILHNLKKIDPLTIKLAETEKIALVASRTKTLNDLQLLLKKL